MKTRRYEITEHVSGTCEGVEFDLEAGSVLKDDTFLRRRLIRLGKAVEAVKPLETKESKDESEQG